LLNKSNTRRLQIILILCIALLALSIGLVSVGKQYKERVNQQASTESLLYLEESLLSFIANLTQIGYQSNLANAQYQEFAGAVANFPNLAGITNIWLINSQGTYLDINTANPHHGYLATYDDTDFASEPINISNTPLWASYFFGANDKAYDVFVKPETALSLTLAIPFISDEERRILAVDLDLSKWVTFAKPNQQLSIRFNEQLIWTNAGEPIATSIERSILNNPELVLRSAVEVDYWLYLLPIPLIALLVIVVYGIQKPITPSYNTRKLGHDTVEALDLLIVETDQQGVINWMSRGAFASLKTFNINEGDLLRKHLTNHPRIVSYIHSSLQGEKLTYQLDESGYSFRIKQQPRRDSNEQIIGLSFIIEDITAQIELENSLKHQQLHDKLTSLPNRQLFEQQLNHDIHRAKRRDTPVAILAIEINGLGDINKTFGHQMGDNALQHIAAALRQEIREEDMLSRFSSDEFLVICDDYQDPIELRAIANRVINRTTTEFTINHQSLTLSANIGIATYPRDSKDAGSLISNAIAAMRHARQSGRNTLDYFSTENAEIVQRKWQLEQSLTNATKAQSFELHYQPIFDINTSRCKGAEALIRWPASTLTPDQFIPMAEQSGLMHSIGSWVLETSLHQLQVWQNTHPNFQYISVNVSVAQLNESNFIETVNSIVQKYPFKAGSVVLELTESIMMSTNNDMMKKLNALTKMGFKIAIDDFGMGYSSLSYLKYLPIDMIKIDKSFLDGVPKVSSNVLICEAIIQMSRALNLRIVAEGIETPEQLTWLAEKGVSTAQGFFFAKALPADQFATFLPKTES
jgi:diguanylate cyclase (GGDEF)-like protein